MSLKKYLCAAVSASVLCASMPAMAQNLPGSADPSRVENQIQEPQFSDDIQPDIRIPELRIEGAPDGADQIKFTLKSIDFEGVTAFSQEELREVYDEYLGTTISLTEFYGIADKVLRKYRNSGYIISQVVVPVQTIDNGEAKLRVIEGFIDKVRVDSEKNTSDIKQIKKIANGLTKQRPLTAETLERYLLIINDLPGVNARSIIRPSEGTVGGADIDIILSRKTREYLVGMDNFGSRYLGPVQFTAAAQLINNFNLNERITMQFVSAPIGNELYYGSVSGEFPVGNEGTLLNIDVSRSQTRPGFDLERFDVEGDATEVGVFFEHPFVRTRNENFSMRFGVDTINQESDNALGVPTEDDIRSLRIGANYQKVNSLLGLAVDTFDIEFSKGLELFGASNDGAANLTRPGGKAGYFKIAAEYQRLQRLSSVVSVLGAAKGQWSNDELLSSEEFGVGGIDYGRGYDASEIIGDRGYALKFEIQLNDPFDIPDADWDSYQLYGFYDMGTTWDDNAQADSERRNSLASAGAGVRADFTSELSGDLYVAFPLTRKVQTQDGEDPRIFASIRRRF